MDPEELFGEVAAFSGGKRTVDVIAMANTEVLVVSWHGTDRVSKSFPRIGLHLFRNLSSVLSQKLAETQDFAVEHRAIRSSMEDRINR